MVEKDREMNFIFGVLDLLYYKYCNWFFFVLIDIEVLCIFIVVYFIGYLI